MTTTRIQPDRLRILARTGDGCYADISDFGVGREMKSRIIRLPFSSEFLLCVKDPVGRELFSPVSVGELKLMVSRSEDTDTAVASQFLDRIPEVGKEMVLAYVYGTRVRGIGKASTTQISGSFSEDGAEVLVTRGAGSNRRELFRKDFVLERLHEK